MHLFRRSAPLFKIAFVAQCSKDKSSKLKPSSHKKLNKLVYNIIFKYINLLYYIMMECDNKSKPNILIDQRDKLIGAIIIDSNWSTSQKENKIKFINSKYNKIIELLLRLENTSDKLIAEEIVNDVKKIMDNISKEMNTR